MQLVQAMHSANVRADAIVLNSAPNAYTRNRPPQRSPRASFRVTCNAGAFRPPRSPSVSSGHYVVIRSSLHASAERPGRHGGSLAAADELWPALLTKVVKLYGSYAALDGGDLVRHA
jgi:hypothetical protein